MQVEIDHLSPFQKEFHFKSWCRSRGIRRFLLDLDDTICPTKEMINSKTAEMAEYLSQKVPKLSKTSWQSEIDIVNDRLFQTMYVVPKRWNFVVDEIAFTHSLSEEISLRTKQILAEIYTTPLQFMPEAENGLKFLRQTDTPLGIVTHAGFDWTWKKYNWLGLDRFLPWNDVFIVDDRGPKNAVSWRLGLEHFKLPPESCVAVGDSPMSDINASQQAGIQYRFLIKDPNLWSIHNQPVAADTYQVDHFGHLIKTVILENINSSQPIIRRR